ncbi:MAG: phytoene/squalene synthase family protein [Methanomicrobiaceae archaeon]|nr:phytoene/squalene synthase family protein [Methanomicrobiaceae archaeon]
MVSRTHYRIFQKGSTTYFHSTLFFPRHIREDVFVLYSFVRKADDFVDAIPQQADAFYLFCSRYRDALAGTPAGDIVIDSFVSLMERKNVDPAWVDAFLASMAADITTTTYETLDDLMVYLYGSAEVIGLMMARIMDLPPASYDAARHLGRAMQYINFIRDIAEDLELGRVYFPQDEIRACGLRGLRSEEARERPEAFSRFIRHQIERYSCWQQEGERGLPLLPPSCRIPVKTASDMYAWTARRIADTPFIVYDHAVKPTPGRILKTVLCNGSAVGMAGLRSRLGRIVLGAEHG